MAHKNYIIETIEKLNLHYGKNLTLAIGLIFILNILLSSIFLIFFNNAAPNIITIVAGSEGSSFQKTALKYQAILKKEGITLKIVLSQGSADNLKKLINTKEKIDVGFVQGGGTEVAQFD
ncbi:MAG: hypothetical protein WBP13_09000 [Methylophilaceae bacterium]